MGGTPESSNQQTEPNVDSDAFNFLGPREPQVSKDTDIFAGLA